MDPLSPRVLWLRVRWASSNAREATQTVRGLVLSALIGAVGGYVATQTENPSIWLVLGLALIGVLAPMAAVFIWAFLTIPRRHLEWCVDELEKQIESLQSQGNTMIEEKH